jgi:hypothetical protein
MTDATRTRHGDGDATKEPRALRTGSQVRRFACCIKMNLRTCEPATSGVGFGIGKPLRN